VRITEPLHPVLTRRTRACPATVCPGTVMGPVRCPAAHPPRPPPARLPPAAHPETGSSSTSSSRSSSLAVATAASPTRPARRPPCVAAATSGSPLALPNGSGWRCLAPTSGCSAWNWSTWPWTGASPRRALRRPDRAEHGRRDRYAGAASSDPGEPALAGRAHPRLGQPVRQAALVHRAPPSRGGVLAGAGRRRHRLWPTGPPCLDLLPLADPPRRRPNLLAQALSGRTPPLRGCGGRGRPRRG
jgi:hypothetical protein